MSESILVTTLKQKAFVISVIPDFMSIAQINLLYRGSRDGWKAKDFHRLCDNQGPTLTIVKSSVGRISGGFTTIPWKQQKEAGWQKDEKALVFSVDSELKFPCLQVDDAICHQEDGGPQFGFYCLGIQNMNKPNLSNCSFKDNGINHYLYKVSDDGNGNSVLTGEGGKGAMFTCVELEVF